MTRTDVALWNHVLCFMNVPFLCTIEKVRSPKTNVIGRFKTKVSKIVSISFRFALNHFTYMAILIKWSISFSIYRTDTNSGGEIFSKNEKNIFFCRHVEKV